jgi:hypothetical protein
LVFNLSVLINIIKMHSRSKSNASRSKAITKMKNDTKKVVVNKSISKKKGDEPTTARSAYNFFTIHVAKEMEGHKWDIRGGLMKEVAERWKKMSERAKREFEAMADEDKKNFENNGKANTKVKARSVSKRDTKKTKYVNDTDEEEETNKNKKDKKDKKDKK